MASNRQQQQPVNATKQLRARRWSERVFSTKQCLLLNQPTQIFFNARVFCLNGYGCVLPEGRSASERFSICLTSKTLVAVANLNNPTSNQNATNIARAPARHAICVEPLGGREKTAKCGIKKTKQCGNTQLRSQHQIIICGDGCRAAFRRRIIFPIDFNRLVPTHAKGMVPHDLKPGLGQLHFQFVNGCNQMGQTKRKGRNKSTINHNRVKVTRLSLRYLRYLRYLLPSRYLRYLRFLLSAEVSGVNSRKKRLKTFKASPSLFNPIQGKKNKKNLFASGFGGEHRRVPDKAKSYKRRPGDTGEYS